MALEDDEKQAMEKISAKKVKELDQNIEKNTQVTKKQFKKPVDSKPSAKKGSSSTSKCQQGVFGCLHVHGCATCRSGTFGGKRFSSRSEWLRWQQRKKASENMCLQSSVCI